MHTCAASAATCAEAAEASGARVHVDELTSLALRHVRIGENLLAPGAARALHVDHRQLAQLVSDAHRALDGGDLRGAARLLRRVQRLTRAHEAHERPFLE